MNKSLRTTLSLGLLMATPWLACCAQTEADKIADAQACLDTATDSTALACMSKVEGLNSASSDLIRCSAYFIDQGFSSAERLSKVSKELQDNGGDSGSSTITVLGFMAFSAQKYSMTSNFNLSETAFDACVGSKSSGLTYLASMTRIATATLKALGSYNPSSGVLPTEAEVRSALCPVGGPAPETSLIIGSAAQAAYDLNCKGKDVSSDPVCQQYAEAVSAGTTPEAIGTALATNLCTP